MTRAHLCLALAVGVVVAAVDSSSLSYRTVAAQAPATARSLPTFEVDRAWPKVPPKWKLGDPSSFAIDAQDNVWVLHRPRTLLKPEDAKMAAPPVIVFDSAGNFVKAWGGASPWLPMARARTWNPHRRQRVRVDHRQQLPDQRDLPGSSLSPTIKS